MGLLTGAWEIFSPSSNSSIPQAANSTTLHEAPESTKLSRPSTEQVPPGAPVDKAVVILSKTGRVSGDLSIKKTTHITSHKVTVDGTTYKLIDTIGFDNTTMSDLAVFTHLADYLVDDTRVNSGVTGVLYVHRAGDPVDSGALTRNIRVLSDIVLGHNGISRLTIFVVPEHGMDSHTARQIVSRAKPFRELQDKGATILAASLNQKNIDRVVKSYASQSPVPLRIQREYVHDPQIAVGDQIQKCLGCCEGDSVRLQVEEKLKRHMETHTDQLLSLKTSIQEQEKVIQEKEQQLLEYSRVEVQIKLQLANNQEEATGLQQKLQESQNTCELLLSHLQDYQKHMKEMQALQLVLKDRDTELSELSGALKHVKQLLAKSQEETLCFRQQLQQTQSEYASLRSQLQLQENTEQSDIVRGLKDLNRDIDDVGRLISEYLSDNYLQKVFDRDPKDLTALNARQLAKLKSLLDHVEGRSSLVQTSDGAGMPAEDFLDYAIRVLLCKCLYKRIFVPFHPAIESSQNDLMDSIYSDIRHREPQAVSARWRVDCFKSVYKPASPDAVPQVVDLLVQEFGEKSLKPVLTYFFGAHTELQLQGQHLDRLTRLFRTAWDWNWMLKAGVIMLGDFLPTFYVPTSRFDQNLMEEFEPNPRGPQFGTILGTIGLGLISSRAIGGGKAPEETVVLKATVATRGLYAD
ncbi:hypothetical protein RhiJN_20590 [Ceratobasidium sp. AG-Ba]|nr:hypothetical protein RhiJN_20590 [Ceratobasidium sp. AG-Ba]